MILLAAMPAPGTQKRSQQLSYRWHCPLTECSVSGRGGLSIYGGGQRLQFEVADPRPWAHTAWVEQLTAACQRARHVSREEARLDRYEDSVIFADISGFAKLGEMLKARSRQDSADGLQGRRALPAEQLTKINYEEVNRMVESVVEGGGDVIQFAGDCVIAVFPASDYEAEALGGGGRRSIEDGFSALCLAAGQATHVARRMVEERDEFMKEQLSALRDRDGVHDLDPVLQQLQSDLNIHVAVGAGVIYGYHVGGVDSKWHYVIDGPAMQQVRSADLEAGPGEVVLSREARGLLKVLGTGKMRVRPTPQGNFRVDAYFGPTSEPRCLTHAPSESLREPRLRQALADRLRVYIPQPVVDQIDDGQTWSTAKRRVVSTMFCKLYGIDYEAGRGEHAATTLGAMITQVQAVVQSHHGTVTRVACDDKGTSLVMVYDTAQAAVHAGLAITETVRHLSDFPDKPIYRALIGITTGEVWLGIVGGSTRAEHTVVNLAARLMMCTLISEAGGVLCEHSTQQQSLGSVFAQHPSQTF
jgi:class 3 adenylate cyclase